MIYIKLCSEALLQKGMELNKIEEFQNAEQSMREKVKESRSYIRTLSILLEYVRFT